MVRSAVSAEPEFRSGFACFVGRPNAGKSTLTNALVGQKIAITSSKPQTTRHAVRGIVNRPGAQLVLVDTPGLHKPRTLLGERLNDIVRTTWAEVDVIAVCLPANEKIGPGDRYLAGEAAKVRRTPKVAVAGRPIARCAARKPAVRVTGPPNWRKSFSGYGRPSRRGRSVSEAIATLLRCVCTSERVDTAMRSWNFVIVK